MNFNLNGTKPDFLTLERLFEAWTKEAGAENLTFKEWLVSTHFTQLRFDKDWSNAIAGRLLQKGYAAIAFRDGAGWWIGIDPTRDMADVPRPPKTEKIVESLIRQGWAIKQGSLGYAVFEKGGKIQVIGDYFPLPPPIDSDVVIGDI